MKIRFAVLLTAIALGVIFGGSAPAVAQTSVTAGAGGSTAANIATFSGTGTIDMGNGTPPLLGVPFTTTITTNVNDQGTIGLLLGQPTLPAATVNQGSMTIK